jgi:hypothetical protein
LFNWFLPYKVCDFFNKKSVFAKINPRQLRFLTLLGAGIKGDKAVFRLGSATLSDQRSITVCRSLSGAEGTLPYTCV